MRQPGIAPATTAPPLAVCRNLFKIYYQRASPEAAALRGLDLTVAPGELPAIISGSAIVKSTLLNTPAGTPPGIFLATGLGPFPNPDAADPVAQPALMEIAESGARPTPQPPFTTHRPRLLVS